MHFINDNFVDLKINPYIHANIVELDPEEV